MDGEPSDLRGDSLGYVLRGENHMTTATQGLSLLNRGEILFRWAENPNNAVSLIDWFLAHGKPERSQWVQRPIKQSCRQAVMLGKRCPFPRSIRFDAS
jgi:hypothetical protein